MDLLEGYVIIVIALNKNVSQKSSDKAVLIE